MPLAMAVSAFVLCVTAEFGGGTGGLRSGLPDPKAMA